DRDGGAHEEDRTSRTADRPTGARVAVARPGVDGMPESAAAWHVDSLAAFFGATILATAAPNVWPPSADWNPSTTTSRPTATTTALVANPGTVTPTPIAVSQIMPTKDANAMATTDDDEQRPPRPHGRILARRAAPPTRIPDGEYVGRCVGGLRPVRDGAGLRQDVR